VVIYILQTTRPPQLDLVPASGGLAISWTVPSTNLVMQKCFDLAASDWLDVTNLPTLNLTTLQNEVVLPLSASNAFYRLKTP
jgi:hypothetical protein